MNDESLRRLERLHAAGDPAALETFARERKRAGLEFLPAVTRPTGFERDVRDALNALGHDFGPPVSPAVFAADTFSVRVGRSAVCSRCATPLHAFVRDGAVLLADAFRLERCLGPARILSVRGLLHSGLSPDDRSVIAGRLGARATLVISDELRQHTLLTCPWDAIAGPDGLRLWQPMDVGLVAVDFPRQLFSLVALEAECNGLRGTFQLTAPGLLPYARPGPRT